MIAISNRIAYVKIIDLKRLRIAFYNKTSFVSLNTTIRLMLDFKNPLTTNKYLPRGKINQDPCIVLCKYREFQLYSFNLTIILNKLFICLRFYLTGYGDIKSSKTRCEI